jgi:hypothetical protein
MAKGVSRDRRREAQWRRIIREHTHSGMTIREFCLKSKLPESAFYFWRRELERRQAQGRRAEREQRQRCNRAAEPAGPATAPAFVPVRVAANPVEPVTREARPEAPGRIEIELSGGRRVHVAAPVDRQALADVLAVLEGRSC